jgi:hypothetical protein
VTPRWRDLYTWQPGTADANVHLLRLYELPIERQLNVATRAICGRWTRAHVEPMEETARRPCRECLLVVATELARATTAVGMNLASAIVAEADRIGGET